MIHDPDGTNLARVSLGSRHSKAHPVYASLGALSPCVVVLHDTRCNVLEFAANLPSSVRQSKIGAEVVALVPVYHRHEAPSSLSSSTHAMNVKELVWKSYSRLLAPLMPDRLDDPEADGAFVDGFRYVICPICLGFIVALVAMRITVVVMRITVVVMRITVVVMRITGVVMRVTGAVMRITGAVMRCSKLRVVGTMFAHMAADLFAKRIFASAMAAFCVTQMCTLVFLCFLEVRFYPCAACWDVLM